MAIATSNDDVLSLLGLDDHFDPRVVTAEILRAGGDVATARTIDVADRRGCNVLLPRSEWLPAASYKVGDRIVALQLDDNAVPVVTVSRRELVAALFESICPEVRGGEVRIMDVARAPGHRSKVAVALTDVTGAGSSVDPVAACVGRGANRVRWVSQQLGGEQIDIIPWHPEPATYLANALAPAEVTSVEIKGSSAVAHAPAHLMSAAVGAGGLNSQLAGALVGVTVTVVAN